MSASITEARRYHRYLFQKVRPYLGIKVLEIGSGFGQYTRMLIDDRRDVFATDISTEFVYSLNVAYKAESRFHGASIIDLTQQSVVKDCLAWNPDTLLCMNVLEHIERDAESLRWLYESTKPGCMAVFLTPAHMSLFGFMDEQAGHFRRYTRKTLSAVFRDSGWNVRHNFYINPIGGIGWFIRNRIAVPSVACLNSQVVNDDIRFFDRYGVSLTRLFDPFSKYFFGQSVVVVASR